MIRLRAFKQFKTRLGKLINHQIKQLPIGAVKADLSKDFEQLQLYLKSNHVIIEGADKSLKQGIRRQRYWAGHSMTTAICAMTLFAMRCK